MKKLVLMGVAAAIAAAGVSVPLSSGSSHREAPNIMLDPTADNTDTYAFTAKNAPGSLTVIANWIPSHVAAAGPTFYRFDDRARYYVNIDNTGDGVYDIRYRWTFRTQVNENSNLFAFPGVESFDDPKLFFKQRYDLSREEYTNGRLTSSKLIGRNLPSAPSNVGPKTYKNRGRIYAQANRRLPGGGRAYAGDRDEPFFFDLGAGFDSLNVRVGTGNQGGGKDDFAGQNISTLALQIPEAEVTKDGKSVSGAKAANAVVGVWASTERRRLEVTNAKFDEEDPRGGGFVQVSRLGVPLVNELIIPFGRKDEFNRTQPSEDAARFGKFVVEPELAKVLNVLFKVNAPETNRTDLVQALLQGIPGLNQLDPGPNPLPTDTLKLNLGVPPAATPNRFGVIGGDIAGFPNGRRLEDDVVDIGLQAVAGFLKGNKVPLGDGVDRNDRDFLSTFPYMPLPDSGFDSQPSQRFEPGHAPVPAGGN